jgi:ribosome maturation factor RimP
MIAQQQVREVLEEIIRDTDYFLVDIMVSKGNEITVMVDNEKGITIEQCAEINRQVNLMLDRDVEDYSLVVSSPGLDAPLKVVQQYRKNLGRSLDISLRDGSALRGILSSASDTGIGLDTGEKGSQEKKIRFDDIVKAKINIDF